MIVLGVDPGLSGGLAVCDGYRLLDVIDVPTVGEKAKRRVDSIGVIRFLQKHGPQHAVIERAQAMPDQGASSGFVYGRAVGALEACVEGMMIPHTIIEASAWKKAHGLIGRDKEGSRQRALALFPSAHALLARKLDHNRAEAALMAHFGVALLRGQRRAAE